MSRSGSGGAVKPIAPAKSWAYPESAIIGHSISAHLKGDVQPRMRVESSDDGKSCDPHLVWT